VAVKALHAAEAGVFGKAPSRCHQNITTERIDSPRFIRSKPFVDVFQRQVWVIRSSMLSLPSMYQSTIFGTSVRPRAPPKAEPFPLAAGDQLERPGADLGAGLGHADDDAAAPALVRAFQRLAHHLVLPMHSKL
jgi:hypothetical protein